MARRFKLKYQYYLTLLSIVVPLLTYFNSGCKENSTTIVNSYYEQNLLDPKIKPTPYATYPSANGVGPFDVYSPSPNNQLHPHFFVQFNKLMQPSSFTTNNVHCTGFSHPVIVRNLNTLYYYGSSFNNLIYFEIVDTPATYHKSLYSVGTQYTVTIDTSVVDVNGNHMSAPYSFSFTPEPTFRILWVYPNNNDTINATSQPQIFFNSPMRIQMDSALSVSPLTSGTWSLSYDSLSFTFKPDSGLHTNTLYTILVSDDAEDNYNHPLPQQFMFSFNTYSFQILSTVPSNGTVAPYLYRMFIYTNATVDTTSFRIALGINPTVRGNFSYFDKSAIVFYPDSDFIPNSSYQVTISKQLKSQDGDTLSNDFVFSFFTPQFNIRTTSPKDRATNVNRTSSIRISFNGRIDASSMQSAFSITPSVSGHFVQSESEFLFVPDTSLASFTAYQVSVSTSMLSIGGYNLSQPYSFSFATRP